MAKWRYPMFGLLAALLAPLVLAAGLPAYTGKFNEAYRPAYHFTPPNGWMNDPNGLIFHKGRYHLFYQYHPDATVWGPMHWGHAESTDLTHWTHQPIALYPDALGWIFSGSAVTDSTNSAGFGAEALVAVFTYHNDAIWKQGRKNTESQGLAYSLDAGRSWTKYAGNPVLDNSGEQDFRDPKVFRHGDGWRMVLAAGDRIKIFSSADLKQWRFESDFKEDEPGADLGVWECPDLLRLRAEDGRERWLMIVNHGDKAPNGGSGTRYFVGDFDGRQFTATQPARWLDAGTDFYAGVSFADAPGGKPLLLAWMSNWQYAQKTPTSPWRSAMTLPRELRLVPHAGGYRVHQRIAADFDGMDSLQYRAVKPALPFERGGLDLGRADIRFNAAEARDLEIELANADGEVFRMMQKDGRWWTDRSRSGQTAFSPAFAAKPQAMDMDGEPVRDVRLLVDRGSVEILLNDGAYSMTNQVFPRLPYSILRIRSAAGTRLSYLRIDAVASIWK